MSLERLVVRAAQRGKGLGKGLLVHLAKTCVANGWSRLQWSVLDWNTPSIEFYKSLGAVLMDEWTVCRIGGPALTALAQGARWWKSSLLSRSLTTAWSALPGRFRGGSTARPRASKR